jgi:hypothetical protein
MDDLISVPRWARCEGDVMRAAICAVALLATTTASAQQRDAPPWSPTYADHQWLERPPPQTCRTECVRHATGGEVRETCVSRCN